jgi:hypothetical protein
MRRNLLGIVSALLLIVGGVSAFGGPGGEAAQQFSGVCIKSGLVLGALWLALPQILALIAKSPRWLLGWFAGKGKAASNPVKPAAKAAPTAPLPPPPPRPRRRSNR